MIRALALLALMAACDVPSPALRFRLAQGDTQNCGTSSCIDVELTCETYLSIRIVDPEQPDAPYISQCEPVPVNNNQLCSMISIDLDPVPVPVRTLEVQVALYPADMVTLDPETREHQCPTDTRYDAIHGFPLETDPSPALGGRAFYRPGDEEVVVTLGCTNLEALNDPICSGEANVRVLATVEDFDRRNPPLFPFEADRLSISVGEPRSEQLPNGMTMYVLNPGQLTQLRRSTVDPPAWAGNVMQLFTSYACLSVLDATPQSTSTVTCQRATVSRDAYDFTGAPPGVRLAKESLDQILAALGTPFPAQGITIGLVLDRNGNPLAGQTVNAPGATVRYLSSDRTSVVGATTSASGVFVSTDAVFGTVFSTTSVVPPQTATAIGGRIEGKVTIAILRFNEQVVGGNG